MMMNERLPRIPEESNGWDVEATVPLLPQNKSPPKKMRLRHMIMTLFGVSLGILCSLACVALTFILPCNMPWPVAAFIINLIAMIMTVTCMFLSILLNGENDNESLEPSEVTFLTAFVVAGCISQAFIYSTAGNTTWLLLCLLSGPHSVLLLCLWGKVLVVSRQKRGTKELDLNK
jgi:hypothetical protein